MQARSARRLVIATKAAMGAADPNLADKARKLGIPVWKFGEGGA